MSSELKVVPEQTTEDSLAELLIRTHGEHYNCKAGIHVYAAFLKAECRLVAYVVVIRMISTRCSAVL